MINSPDMGIEEILKQCLDSQGYVVFAGIITPERDSEGNNLIRFSYKREHFSYEDTKRALEEFVKHYKKDVESI